MYTTGPRATRSWQGAGHARSLVATVAACVASSGCAVGDPLKVTATRVVGSGGGRAVDGAPGSGLATGGGSTSIIGTDGSAGAGGAGGSGQGGASVGPGGGTGGTGGAPAAGGASTFATGGAGSDAAPPRPCGPTACSGHGLL